MLFYCLWISMPLVALGQTYYINFVFNNNRYTDGQDKNSAREDIKNEDKPILDAKTIELISREQSYQYESEEKPNQSHVHSNTDETREDGNNHQRHFKVSSERTPQPLTKTTTTTNASTICDSPTNPTSTIQTTTTQNEAPTTKTPTVKDQSEAPTNKTPIVKEPLTKPIETTTEVKLETTTSHWLAPTPHSEQFFDYPEATCHEDMSLHEVFGITLARDRGLPAKILCDFRNSWAGPWLLMTRMQLPARVHMRHWFFGYLTDDYKDMNINFLALAHIINNMRLAMLIIGQNNDNQLVYNLYDDVVISGFNDLFMLRKAHLVEANTTDLLFISVGEVLESDTGRNRSCPFRVFGAWWGPKWDNANDKFCVFPVERDVERPGYVAIFIKPSPFKVNNTAFYEQEITTRRPWASTIKAELMKIANNDRKLYDKLNEQEFLNNKLKVKEELRHRESLNTGIEEQRLLEAKQEMRETT